MAENSEGNTGAPSPANPQATTATKGQFDHPVFKKLAVLNGEINKMTRQQLADKLGELHLDTRGLKDVLKKRLKNYFKYKNLSTAEIPSDGERRCRYNYLLVIDFEATCDRETSNYSHEIIEFPIVLIDTATGDVVDEFHSYVRPVVNARLSAFCTELTGISQDQTDKSPTFPEVLAEVENWMESHQLGKDSKKFAIVTDGPWDMSRFMFMQCQTSSISYPKWARRWINVRKTFCNKYRTKKASILTMLESFGLAFEGQQHSGIADARNIARIVTLMMKDGCTLRANEQISNNQLNDLNGHSRFAEVTCVPRDKPSSSDEDNKGADLSDVSQGLDSGASGDSALDVVGEGGSDVGAVKEADCTNSDVDDCADLLRYVAIQNS